MSEQPNPIRNNETPCIDMAHALIESRRAPGLETYGVLLQPFNGRDFGLDSDQELADFVLYYVGLRAEQRRKDAQLEAVVHAARKVVSETGVKHARDCFGGAGWCKCGIDDLKAALGALGATRHEHPNDADWQRRAAGDQ